MEEVRNYLVQTFSTYLQVPSEALTNPQLRNKDETLSVYTSELVFVVFGFDLNGKSHEYDLVIKSAKGWPNNLPARKEVGFYSTTLRLLPSAAKDIFVTVYPGSDQSKIVMDNMTAQGYGVIDPNHRGLSRQAAELVLIRLDSMSTPVRVLTHAARFHAYGSSLKASVPAGQFPTDELKPFVEEIYESSKEMLVGLWEQGAHKTLATLVEDGPEFKPSALKVQARVRDLRAFWASCLRPAEPLATLCHGDLWTANLLFKNDLTDAKFIDMQVVRYGNPSLDLSNFFCISVSPDALVNGGLEELLNIYLRQLNETRTSLGLEEVALSALLADFYQFGIWGLANALQWLPLMMRAKREDQAWEMAGDLQKTFYHPDNKPLAARLHTLLTIFEKHGWLD